MDFDGADTDFSPFTAFQGLDTGIAAPQTTMPSISAADISTRLETGHSDPMKGMLNISPDTEGSRSYGNYGLNSLPGASAWQFRDTYGHDLGLTANPGTPEFDAQWKQAASSDPQKLRSAETDWYNRNITSGVTGKLSQIGIPANVASDPRVQAYFADRMVQQGEGSITMGKHAQRIGDAWERAGGDPVAFLKAMSAEDLSPQALRSDFPRALASGAYSQRGNFTRVTGRLNGALGINDTSAASAAPPDAVASAAPQPMGSPQPSAAAQPRGISGIAHALVSPVRKALGMSDDYGNGPAGFTGSPQIAQALIAQALQSTPNNQAGWGNSIGKLAMLLAGRNMMAQGQGALANALFPQGGGAPAGPPNPSAGPGMPQAAPPAPAASPFSQPMTSAGAETGPAMNGAGIAPSTVAEGEPTKNAWMGEVGSSAPAPQAAQPQPALMPAPGPQAAVGSGPAAAAGAHGMPEFIAPTAGVQPLPSEQQIRALLSNPQSQQLGMQLYQMRLQALQPTTFTTPDGHTYIGNNYTGWHLSGLPAKPTIEKFAFEAGGVKGESPKQLTYDAAGNPVYKTIPTVGEGSRVPTAKNATEDPFPSNGSPQEQAAWAERANMRKDTNKAASEAVGKTETEITEQANNALGVKSTLSEMRNLLQGFSPNMGTEAKEKIGNAFVTMGVSQDTVNKWLGVNTGDIEAFKKNTAMLAIEAVKQISNRATQMEFQRFLENNPNVLMTPQGIQRVIDRMDKVADASLDKQQAWADYKNAHPADKWGNFNVEWNQQQRKAIEGGAQNSDRTGANTTDKKPAAAVNAYQEGQTATNPKTGVKMVFKSGQWVAQ